MKLYADYPSHRVRQILADASAVVALWAVVACARWLGDQINGLKVFGRRMEDAGGGFERTMKDVGGTLSDVPLVGDGMSAPFDAAASAGRALAQAGVDQQASVGELAVNLAIGASILPLAAILVMWLVPRIRFVVRAARTRRLIGTEGALDLLALRALLTQDPLLLLAAVESPADAWRDRDKGAIRTLAALELRSTGIAIDRGARARRRTMRPLA